MIAGVCGGVAAYFSVDANLIRLLAAVLVLFGGAGLFIYMAGWLLLPEQGQDTSIAQRLVGKLSSRNKT